MAEQASSSRQIDFGNRLKLGILLFVFSVLIPIVGIPAVTTLGFSKSTITLLSGLLFAGGEILGIAAIAVMGRPGYDYIKTRTLKFLHKHGPPSSVSQRRYRIGLVMFCLPLLFAWVSLYLPEFIPGFESNPLVWGISGDILLVSSLFVLGGDFWDKIRALLKHDSKADLSQN
jgi:hypothetical protein